MLQTWRAIWLDGISSNNLIGVAMELRNRSSKLLIWTLMLTFWTACVVSPAYADIVTTEQLAAEAELQMQRDALSEKLMREDVKQEMAKMGIDPQMVEERIASLTAAEIEQIQGQLDSLPAGSGVLGTILIVLLILILLEITGSIDIFSKI